MENSCGICRYTAQNYAAFKELLGECFSQDYNIPLTKDQLEELCGEITRQAEENIVFLDLLTLDGAAKGFISYQIDSLKSDWCEKEGCGFIRELFVASNLRGKGYGKYLVAHAENELKKLSVPYIYLTTDDSEDFWAKAGYRDTGEICAKNNGGIFIK